MWSQRFLICALIVLVTTSTFASSTTRHPSGDSKLVSRATNHSKQETPKLTWKPSPLSANFAKYIPILNKELSSKTPIIRTRSAFLLGQINARTSIPQLRTHLRDSDKGVRIQSGIALACMSDPSGIDQCSVALKTSPPWIRYYAVYGLWRVNTAKSKAILDKASDGGSDLVKSALRGARTTRYAAPAKPKKLPTPAAQVKVSKLWIDTASLLNQEADEWFHQGDYEQAIRCQEAAVLFATDSETYSNIAYLQWSLGRDTEAINTLTRSVNASPKDPDAYFYLGQHYYITKRFSKAEQPLKKSVDLGGEPLNRRIYAHCLEKLGKNQQALEQWKIIVKSGTDNGSGMKNLERVQKLIKH